MSIYNNETKIYRDLNPTTPQEPQSYWLNKPSKLEAYFFNEIEVREQTAKKIKWFNTITGIVDTDLITLAVITGGISTAAFATRKSFKILTVKLKQHDAIKLLVQSKWDSIPNIISQAILDGDISPTQFHKVPQEVVKYRRLKADIRNQAKTKVKEITKEQR